MTTTTTTQQELLTMTGLHGWEQTIGQATASFEKYSDEDLLQPVAPGKNRVIYLLGHLTAVHDRMIPLLGLGERLYPQLDEPFLTNPDDVAFLPDAAQLRECWARVNRRLTEHFRNWTTEDWLSRHEAVSPQDFAKEPHRNKFSVVLNRSRHLSYHLGQLALFKK
jgi:hypothetical protein